MPPSPPRDREADPAPRAHPLGRWVPEGVLYDGSAILDRFLSWAADSGIEPYPAQEEALLELMAGQHVILSTPTGSGKSLVALGLHYKAMCEGKRSFYTAPIKALVSEKFFDLCEHFGAENVGMLTGDASINWAAPIVCCTAEVLANMALGQGTAAAAPYVVMDEFHYYSDRDRGSAWHIPLVLLRRTRFLLMSATLGDTRAIERAIEERTQVPVSRVHTDERPVPLDYSYALTSLHETVEKLMRAGKAPIYIVHFTQREAAEKAQALTSAALTDKEEKRAITAALGGFRFDSPYGKDIQRFLRHGIGLHHAGLLPKYRLLVERLAQQGLLKVICGTDTLGVGVNVPIRTVLFTRLCKFDGEKTSILSVRDFKQISGRAGRKGFDDQGSVVAQAPEHVIENLKLDAKAAAAKGGGRKKVVKKKPPTKGFVNWTEETLHQLVENAPETLVPRLAITHGLVISCLQSDAASRRPGAGYRALIELVDHSHMGARERRALRRDAARIFRSLRAAELVEVVPDPRSHGPTVRVAEDLQSNFSLHHSLSLYMVDAVSALDPTTESFALDVLSVTEAILESPRPILIAQERKARGELIARLKADGVPYEERMEKVEEVTWPKPNEEMIYATFDLFLERHPWLSKENIRPKGIARDLFEDLATFHDYVKRMELARVEGLLLRYLSQVHNTLAQSVPERQKSEEVKDMIAFFRGMLTRVDSSLLEEWESLMHPREEEAADAEAAREYDLALDPRALRARIRSEFQSVVRALAFRQHDRIAELVAEVEGESWDERRIDELMAPFYAACEAILYEPRARQAHLCVVTEVEPRIFAVRQALLDDTGDDSWALEARVDLRDELNPSGPLLELMGLLS